MAEIREEAIKMIKTLPDGSSWDDIMYELYVRQKIEQGLKDVESGRGLSLEEAKSRLLKR